MEVEKLDQKSDVIFRMLNSIRTKDDNFCFNPIKQNMACFLIC